MKKGALTSSGNLAALALAVLRDAPRHGYAIAREIAKRSDDALAFGEGTLYPALRTLEADGFIEGRWETTDERGPARRIYHITASGNEELERAREAWSTYSRSIDKVFAGRSAPRPKIAGRTNG